MADELILAVIISADIFLASAAYCGSGIRIPPLSAAVIAITGAGVLWLTLSLSALISGVLSPGVCSAAAFVLISITGISTIFRSIVRTVVRTLSEKGDLSLKMGSQGLMLKLYLDDTAADADHSKVLSAPEAAALAAASSLDCAAAGLSCGALGLIPWRTGLFAFAAGIIAIALGNFAGKKICALPADLSWVGGVMLIVFAAWQIFG